MIFLLMMMVMMMMSMTRLRLDEGELGAAHKAAGWRQMFAFWARFVSFLIFFSDKAERDWTRSILLIESPLPHNTCKICQYYRG